MSADRQAVSEALEVIGRAFLNGEFDTDKMTARLGGALSLLAVRAQALDRPPPHGWPGDGTVADRRAEAHLRLIEANADHWLAALTNEFRISHMSKDRNND